MARIERFVQKTLDRVSLHAPISADLVAYELDGRKLLQINTSGSASRQIPGKVSQSIQLDERSARQLYDALRSHFGFK